MAAFLPWIPVATQVIQSLLDGGRSKSGGGGGGDNAALREELRQYREQHTELLKSFNKLVDGLKDKKIDSFESLAQQDERAKKALIELAQKTEPMKMVGINIGLFGITSTGKSTMLNSLLGKKIAETGVGETTTKITPYQGMQYTLWDVPGRNDEINYLSMEYISFFKGLTRRLILIQATIKENSSGGGGEENAALREELHQYREQHSELLQRFNELLEQMKEKKIDSFEELGRQDKKHQRVLVELAQKTEPMKMVGINIGLFGITSTGKSTMLNSLLGKKVAETGVGETTTKITPYQGMQYTLWDVPGRNDEINYL
ncbi:unnamed protein product, partial [Rotaria sp. Silwood2]